MENIDASLAILKHACNFQTFQHKIVEKLQNLPQASLQELKFISEFIGDLDSKEEIQNIIIGHIQKKRFPKIAEKTLSGSDSSLHLALQVIDFQKVFPYFVDFFSTQQQSSYFLRRSQKRPTFLNLHLQVK